MRDGLRVYDADTHANPAAEVLERYVDPGFRPRLADLAPCRAPVGRPGRGYHLSRRRRPGGVTCTEGSRVF